MGAPVKDRLFEPLPLLGAMIVVQGQPKTQARMMEFKGLLAKPRPWGVNPDLQGSL